MSSSRAERRQVARTEAGIKLAFICAAMLALMIGGISGFAGALTALLILASVLGLSGLASWFILKSRLVHAKKFGLLLLIGASLTVWFWNASRPPPRNGQRSMR